MLLVALPSFSITRTRRQVRRVGEVVRILTRYGFAGWVKDSAPGWVRRWFSEPDGQLLAVYSVGERLRLAFTELGTTYIKFGQMLSTRPDIVGPEVADELAKLQSSTPADPPEVVRNVLAVELGRPVEEIYAEFDFSALGSASIGQVHAARLHDGTQVVVKVQHDGIEYKVRADLEIMRQVAELAERYISNLPYQPAALLEEFERQLTRELDLRQEMRNLQRFTANFAGQPIAKFPYAYPDFTTAHVLTMERLDGFQVSDRMRLEQSGIDPRRLAKDGAGIWIDMIFRDGFFHADPHPGNLIVLSDGRAGVLDCGMVGRLDNLTREALEDMLIVFVSRDVDGIVDVIMRICTLPRGFDRHAFTADVDLFIADYLSGTVREMDISGMITALVSLVYKYHVIVPANIIMLGKTIALLEGTSRLLDPDFDLAELAAPYFMQILERRYTPQKLMRAALRSYRDWRRLLLTLPRDMADLLADARAGELRVQFQIRGLDKVINRLVAGIVAAAFLLGSSLMWGAGGQPEILGIPVVAALGFCCGAAIVAILLWAIFRSGGV